MRTNPRLEPLRGAAGDANSATHSLDDASSIIIDRNNRGNSITPVLHRDKPTYAETLFWLI